jgi:hypothetical protein
MAEPVAFDDADDLEVPASAQSDAQLIQILQSLFRAELLGTRANAVKSAVDAVSAKQRPRLLLALADALHDEALVQWIEASRARIDRAVAIARALAPHDPSSSHNAASILKVRSFTEWSGFEYRLIVVPGYTPLDQKTSAPGVHPVTCRRLEMALEDHRAHKAPFILVSGANVYPRGTEYYEAVEMKKALCAMGLDEDRVIVEARARHTPTNLRNAGRFMRAHGVAKALVVTKGGGVGGSDFFGQDFYLANPGLSTFHSRCERELGYKVGELRGVGDGRIEFETAATVDRPSYRDPLDP